MNGRGRRFGGRYGTTYGRARRGPHRLFLIGLHAAAVIADHHLFRDNSLRRMLPELEPV